MSEIRETKSSTYSISDSSENGIKDNEVPDKSNESKYSKALSNSAFFVICILTIVVSFSVFGALIYVFRGGDSPNASGKKVNCRAIQVKLKFFCAATARERMVEVNVGRCGSEK